jgi:hypothetical protein
MSDTVQEPMDVESEDDLDPRDADAAVDDGAGEEEAGRDDDED